MAAKPVHVKVTLTMTITDPDKYADEYGLGPDYGPSELERSLTEEVRYFIATDGLNLGTVLYISSAKGKVVKTPPSTSPASPVAPNAHTCGSPSPAAPSPCPACPCAPPAPK